MARALAPSNNRSRWRSRNDSLPSWTRSPSHTPSPSMKPESNTETTASARGLSSPLTLIRTDALRGSETSWSDLPIALAVVLDHFAARHHEVDVLEHTHVGQGIAGDRNDVGGLARLDRPDLARQAEQVGGVDRR